jgi:hypothetical protein
MKKTIRIIPVITFLLSYLNGCHPSFPLVEWKRDYPFSSQRNVGVFIIPSDSSAFDKIYSGILCHYVMSRGYAVVDLNILLQAHKDTLLLESHTALMDSLLKIPYLPRLDAIAITGTRWDSVRVITNVKEYEMYSGKLVTYQSNVVPTLYNELSLFDVKSRSIVLSTSGLDTCTLYAVGSGDELLYRDYPWMLAARLVLKELDDMPVCNNESKQYAAYRYPVVLYVDRSYREFFHDEWKKRILLRMLLVNDILRRELGLELEVRDAREWDTSYELSLEKELKKLKEYTPSRDKTFYIAITLNHDLKKNWYGRSNIGLASYLDVDAVVTAQPSFRGLAGWSCIEEAVTLAHEIGHMFGALHSTNPHSIMYPCAGYMPYRFDDVNKRIIALTKREYFEGNEEARAGRYMQALENIRSASLRNSVHLLETCSWTLLRASRFHVPVVLKLPPPKKEKNIFGPDTVALSYLPPSRTQVELDSSALCNSISKYVQDTVLQMAIAGCIEYKLEHLENALGFFKAAAERQPDFGEVHWYLSAIFDKLHMKDRADLQQQMAEKLSVSPFIDR